MGCSDDDSDDVVVTTRSSNTADFTSFETFAFPDPSDANQTIVASIPTSVATNLDQVNDAVRQQLIAQGLTEVDPDQDPDLTAVNLASTKDRAGYTWSCVPDYWWGYWTYAYDPCAWLEPVYTEYTTGTVAVGLVDNDAEQVVFSGILRGVLDPDADADQVEQNVDDGVAEIFDSYPADQTGVE
jgi:hypothetical protein